MFLWDYLRSSGLPIVVYGMGNGADKIFAYCHDFGLAVAAVFSSDDHARNITFHGLPVLRYADIQSRFPRAAVLLAFGVYDETVLRRIDRMSGTYEVCVPDLPLFGGPLISPDYLRQNEDQIAAARALFSDETSRNVFDAMLEAKLTGALSAHRRTETDRASDLSLLRLGDGESYLDLGAYNGDTVLEFLALTGNRYRSIDAMEPDAHNFRKLAENLHSLPNVTLHPFASWESAAELAFCGKGGRNCALVPEVPGKYTHLHTVNAISVDSLQRDFSYVKLDVEGAERETLLGMQHTLVRCRPRLCVSAYHRTDDFITLPLLLQTLCPGYRMYLRRNRCLPAWEIHLYAVWPDTI